MLFIYYHLTKRKKLFGQPNKCDQTTVFYRQWTFCRSNWTVNVMVTSNVTMSHWEVNVDRWSTRRCTCATKLRNWQKAESIGSLSEKRKQQFSRFFRYLSFSKFQANIIAVTVARLFSRDTLDVRSSMDRIALLFALPSSPSSNRRSSFRVAGQLINGKCFCVKGSRVAQMEKRYPTLKTQGNVCTKLPGNDGVVRLIARCSRFLQVFKYWLGN